MSTQPNGSQPVVSPGSAIYVDTENLRESDHAQSIVWQVVTDWPAERPPVASLSLYVRADKTELWQLWAETAFPALRVRVRGVQHFSNHRAKNSADLAITADAVADLITGQAISVAVVSNDSDFGALFVKVLELAGQAESADIPFLWITAPDAGTLSAEIEQFIPDRYRWDLSADPPSPAPPGPAPTPAIAAPARKRAAEPRSNVDDTAAPAARPQAVISHQAIAEELMKRLPVGTFKAADAEKVIQQRWPEHPAVGDTARFGQFLGKEIWPLLQEHGVTMPRRSSPRTYEIPSLGRGAVADPPSRGAEPRPFTGESSLVQLVAAVAAGITDDVFKASDAQDAMKGQQLHHPAASFTATQFGTWFAKQLWPIMEQHGVTIAKEKPRRYEMTPYARQNLIALA